MMKSYAQNFEDVILWRALKDVSHGFYVDVGAQHPVLDSVSRWFYEQGWRGVHVEPVPFYADLLRQDRPDEDVIAAVVCDEMGDHPIYVFPDTGLSTMSPQIAETHKGGLGLEWQKRVVPSLTLSDLFARTGNREVHWLKVDVEGQERAVLASWADNPVRPWVVLVEATYPNTQIETHEEWEALLTSRGYAFVYADGLNRYYLHETHEDRRDHFRYPPNYFDHFSLGEHWATADLRNCNRQDVDDLRRQAEAEKAQAIAQSDERDARMAAAIADQVHGQVVELAMRVSHEQEALESRLLIAQREAQQIMDAERKAESAQLLSQLERIEAVAVAICADVNKSDMELQATNEALCQLVDDRRQLVSRLDDDRHWLDEQITGLSTNLRSLEQALCEVKSSRWRALLAVLRPRKEDLLKGGRVPNTAPLWRKSRIFRETNTKPVQGSDSLTADTTLQAVTLGELYALPPAEFIRVSYRILLDRDTDRGGLSHYLSRMALGDSRLNIHRSIAKSKEYRTRAAYLDLLVLDNEAFVEAAYRRVLGRAPDDAGRAHYLDQIRNGKSRAGVLKSLARSTEAKLGSQPALRLRQEIEASLAGRWTIFGPSRSSRRLAQLDFTLSTAIQRIEADLQRQMGELRTSAGWRDHGFVSDPLALQAGARQPRPRWVPRDLQKIVTPIAEPHEDRTLPMHPDYQALARRMRQEAPFGQLRDDGNGQFSDYLESDFQAENHDGIIVRWIGAEAVAYLRPTGARFNLQAAGFFEERSVLVSFNDVVVGTLRFGKEHSVENLQVGDWVGRDVAIRLKCSGIFNPGAAGINSDQRDLGLLIRSIYFD